MAGGFVGVGGTARKIKAVYVGVDGVARKITKAYVGVDGVAKPWWKLGSAPSNSMFVRYRSGPNAIFAQIDTATNAVVNQQTFDSSSVYYTMTGMDGTINYLYALNNQQLYEIDTATYALTAVGPLNYNCWLGCTSDRMFCMYGSAYWEDGDTQRSRHTLYEIDIETLATINTATNIIDGLTGVLGLAGTNGRLFMGCSYRRALSMREVNISGSTFTVDGGTLVNSGQYFGNGSPLGYTNSDQMGGCSDKLYISSNESNVQVVINQTNLAVGTNIRTNFKGDGCLFGGTKS